MDSGSFDFALVVTHALKEPLRGISNYANYLLDDHGEQLGEAGRHRVETIQRLCFRMTEMLDDLHCHAMIAGHEQTIDETNVREIVIAVLETLQVALKERNATAQIGDLPESVCCNAALVREVFRNLITNAIKYNDESEPIVEVGANADQEFFVRDNGIGIRRKDWEPIFQVFHRLHCREAYGGGTGIGLAIVHKIVECHGGRIRVESEVGSGTTFFFTLGHAPQ